MFNKNNWHEPIYKNDLKNVLLFGITTMILCGIITGLFDALLNQTFGLGVSFSLLLNALAIGFAVKKGYYSYHILYPVLALCFYFTALFISFVSYEIGVLGITNIGPYLITWNFYLSFLLKPVYYLVWMINNGFDIMALIFLILNVLFYVLGFISVYRIAKGKN